MIVTIVENIVAAISVSPAPSFFRGLSSFQNYWADNATMPVILMDEPRRVREEIKQSGAVFPTYRLTMFFGDMTDLGDLQADLDEVVNEQAAYRREFLLRLNEAEGVLKVTNIAGMPFYNEKIWDVCLSGWTFECEVQCQDDSSICFEQAVDNLLCEAIENATAQEIADCLSPGKEAALEDIICPISADPVDIKDQEGNVIDTVECGGEYVVYVLDEIYDGTPLSIPVNEIVDNPF